MRDIVILIPGILGSALKKDGRDLYPPLRSRDAAWDLLTNKSMHSLKLDGDDDYRIDDLDDGIIADRLVHDDILIAGLNFRILRKYTYTQISDYLVDELNLEKGSIDSPKPANYFEFPYDWRRDNRASALRLQNCIDKKLNLWHEAKGAKNAKVILIAHSMGGLVARYYLEVLGGWMKCKALITFGTPYRGSIDALNYLANGYRIKGLRFSQITEAMRSFTSVYQLLPIYPAVQTHNGEQRLSEIEHLPETIKKDKVMDALQFHWDIISARDRHDKVDQYRDRFQTIPFIGTGPKTLQSILLSDGILTGSYEPLASRSQERSGGDGTVPSISATPHEFDTHPNLRGLARYMIAPHATIQSHADVLKNLVHYIKDLQQPSKSAYLGALEETGITLELEDVNVQGDPIIIHAEIHGNLPIYLLERAALVCTVQDLGETFASKSFSMKQCDHRSWLASIEGLVPGLYQVEVRPTYEANGLPRPVRELFAVIS
jgi:Lecithin:cholesterol acyltransferase